ncbi:M57 family metalloprotease [Aquimarina pacifica]|uniref:M57 family metalloprotease n=1 Tax=Aquimarina pacifica TaxID=1296415 RepID=UPI00046F6762|nr:M57 family metalloprotease [Aquimarina pacifica]
MKKIKILALCAIVTGALVSCEKTEFTEEAAETTAVEKVSPEHLEALTKAGVNTMDAEYKMIQHPGEEPYKALVSGDIIFELDKLAEYALAEAENNNKQYRTNNLVSDTNISIIGYTGSGYALTSNMQTALQWAVNNYNRLNTSLNFTLTYAASTNADMVVYNNGASGGGGSAGFPSGGQPYKWVQINNGTSSFSTNVNEHVITHEIGHSIGFRHQDWQSRQSCGQNSNEGTAGVGAILINGTPSSDFADSIMLACFSSSEDGEFSSTDITALETLY